MTDSSSPPLTPRRIIFQLHWLLGVTAGLVLTIMGLTGASLAFEDEIQAALIGKRADAANAPPLSPAILIERAAQARPGEPVVRLVVESDPAIPARVSFAGKGDERRATYLVDRSDGRILGPVPGDRTFATLRRVHRWLALPGNADGLGPQITGFAALSLIFFAISGLYLRWPRRPLDWRNWVTLDLRKTGRNLYRELHVMIGSWICLAYLVSALSGLWWSYDWYRSGLEALLGGRPPSVKIPGEPSPTLAWSSFERATGGRAYAKVTMILPAKGAVVQFRALPPGARHERQDDQVTINGVNGKLMRIDRFADRSAGSNVLTSMFEIHRGAFFGWPGRIVLFLTSLTMPLFTVTGLLLYFSRRRRRRALLPEERRLVEGTPGPALVVYASQSGSAEQLARRTAAMLGDARVVSLARLDLAELRAAGRGLFIISTYGEGEPPDTCRAFARRTMAAAVPDLTGLDYAVLALGDREYPAFCAFGHAVDAWLHSGGGRRMFDLIEMDGEDIDAQRHWQQRLALLGAHTELADWEPAAYGDWRLIERQLLNPDSLGNPVYSLLFEPVDPDMARDWRPGAIAEILLEHAPPEIETRLPDGRLAAPPEMGEHAAENVPPEPCRDGDKPASQHPPAHREYSVASLAQSGRVELVVRRRLGPAGSVGLVSGYLTSELRLGASVPLRLRDNPGFSPPDDAATPLILIGNGTGIAGLLSHVRERARTNGGPVWLLHGERSRAHDALYEDELAHLQATGVIVRTDRAWSRDPAAPRYVQDLIGCHRDQLDRWVERGATIMVCGSLAGMAPGVDAALRAVLGDAAVEHLTAQDRYRRDIY